MRRCARLTAEALPLFRQESMCYLTGYDTVGYVDFQVMVLSAAGDLTLLTRAADRPQARYTSQVEVFDVHARVLDAAGYREQRMHACGYSLGATCAASWMDWPMFYRGNPIVARAGKVFFIHSIVFDADQGEVMTLEETVVVTPAGNDALSKASRELIVSN